MRWPAQSGDQPGHERLQRRPPRQLDDLPVAEQVDEKRLDRREVVRAAEIEQDDGCL
jgi:hypothetical protein